MATADTVDISAAFSSFLDDAQDNNSHTNNKTPPTLFPAVAVGSRRVLAL